MQLLINIVLPVFAIIFAGWFAIRSEIMDKSAAKILNNYVYYFAVPPMLFLATAKVPAADIINADFILAFFLAIFAIMAITLAPYILRKSERPMDLMVLSLTTGWPNTIYMGIPIAYFLFGDKGTLPVVIATLSTNAVFIIALALVSGLADSGEKGIAKIWAFLSKAFFKNPVILAPTLGLLISHYQIGLPEAIYNLFEMVAPSAAPVALFSLGLSLYGLSIKENVLQVSWIAFQKLVLHPLIALGIVLWMDLEPFLAASVILMCALPTGSMVYVLAQQYNTRVELASSVIFLTTLGSLITLGITLPLLNAWN
ncbi:AEC family transporter [Neptuniibacter caesariensis]|uniref:Transporter n=1 Tax=Neptuniibacter caesariensis TaxID=207954 RepID=A0A7U8C8T2_NEPCE|nr:AEC family transporter [Neptuniibacter caesariensis]EAR62671.1 hypothetical protein MED92_06118 [Oceanospirillum sp. MED92] [Neptuniibacter caesariensis]